MGHFIKYTCYIGAHLLFHPVYQSRKGATSEPQLTRLVSLWFTGVILIV